MPRYFITTSDHTTIGDEEGAVLADTAALRALMRRTLIEILLEEGERTGVDEFTAVAYDEDGRQVMSARATFAILDG